MDIAKLYEFELDESWFVKNGVLKYWTFVGNDGKSRDLSHKARIISGCCIIF